jgi:hypothetical protein
MKRLKEEKKLEEERYWDEKNKVHNQYNFMKTYEPKRNIP